MTTVDSRPFVLHVDDVPDDLRTWESEVNATGKVRLGVYHPRAVTDVLLRRASVVLVDFKLDEWSERNEAPLGLRPTNGLALLSILQESAYELDKNTPRAFALFTAAVTEVARGLVPRPHIVARAHSLEWIFDKTATDLSTRALRTVELAEAVMALPKPWPGDSPEHASAALHKWLAIPDDAPWRQAAWQAIMRCRPPIHEYAEHTHGIGVLRWAMHRILPYPTFLFDDAHLAARLRVDLGSLKSQLENNEQLQRLLEPARYVGALAAFSGRRWWRAAIESVIFELSSRDPSNIGVLHAQLAEVSSRLVAIDAGILFPVIDENFRIKEQLATAEQVVEVIPDDWPPFADSAWALRTDAEENADLKAITVDGEFEER